MKALICESLVGCAKSYLLVAHLSELSVFRAQLVRLNHSHPRSHSVHGALSARGAPSVPHHLKPLRVSIVHKRSSSVLHGRALVQGKGNVVG